MATTTMLNHVTDDILELEKVAVGPYCVFDAFKPRVSPDAHCTTTATSPGRDANSVDMDNPNMAGYQYGTGVWSTGADDITLTASATDGLDNWNDFMQWGDAPQTVDVKPSNSQGPLCMPDQRPLIERRQNSNITGTSLTTMQPETIPVSAPFQPQINAAPYTFGGDIQNPPAFDFDNSSISPPSSGGGQQQGGMFPSPAWQQQDNRATGAFSAAGFTPAPAAPVQLPPASASTPSLRHSPTSLTNARTSSSSASPSVATSPESMPSNPKKRKSTSEDFETPAAKKDNRQPPKKTAHNMIEKRYRTNLNDKIAALRDSVPSLRVMSRQNGGNEEDDDPEDLEGLTPAHKLNKATVLSKATEYIRHLEKRNKRLMEEVNTLKGRMDSYERMATTGLLPIGGAGPSADGRYHEDPFAGHVPPMLQQSLTGPPQGLIPVPDNMANLHRGHPQQAHYAPQHGYGQYGGATRHGGPAPPMVQGQRGSGMFSKLMVGSLATLMLVEGFSEREQSGDEPNGRGLFALPIHLAGVLAPRISIGGASAQIPLAKVLLLFGALFYFLAPLFDPKPKSKKKVVPGVMLARVPSLASPVEVRRSAWLTAIQTVWVPKHNFCLEAAALGLKTLKLSLRTIIGWPGYALLMGTTKDHEAARVKAWDIALDAQLTGGDAEISKSRLILTLMASGTLPDSPARLMLKALHIRVLLWELTNPCNGGWRLLDDLSAKLARSYWNAARSEQRIAANMASKPDSEAEPLPEHLAALLEMECDHVLIPSIIQRAYNLAWNRPSAENTSVDESMDTVVEDFSICSPLDALAAWWSSHVLRRALAASLASKNGSTKAAVKRDLDLASQTAPSTSQAHLRALVARSILEEEGRSQRITTAFQALPSTPSSSPTTETNNPSQPMPLNVVGEAPMATDVQKALTLTKCLSLVESGNAEGRRRAISAVNNLLLPKSSVTLLSFVAGYKVLNHFTQDASLRKEATFGLERLASSLRIWIGHEPGRRSGLSNKIRGRIVGQCLDASKKLVGLPSPDEVDDGYVSGC